MGYSIFSIGDAVQISCGSFAGVSGTIIAPTNASEPGRMVVLQQGSTMLLPVTVAACIDGHSLTLRVPPELLERLPEPASLP